jgi:hypothetical protein
MMDDDLAPDETPWVTKSQLAVALGRSSRTIDLWVKAGRVERMQDGSRAYFRVATPGSRATPIAPLSDAAELQQILLEIRDELRALRADNEQLRAALGALPPPQLPVAEGGNPEMAGNAQGGSEALPRNGAQRIPWWRRWLYGEGGGVR